MKQIIDARGWECPRPIVETKKLLDAISVGTVNVIVDNRVAVENLTVFSKNSGYDISCEEKETDFFMTITKEVSSEENHCAKDGNLVIQISSDKYGTGEDELGENLMKAYLYALTEAEPKPRTITFINSGVFLTTEGSSVLESLNELENLGVEILSCGACLNFYGLEKSLKVGQVTNMYVMVEKLNNATNAIKI